MRTRRSLILCNCSLLQVCLGVLVAALPVHAHHEAVFGPQSTALLTHPRFVSTQYYFTHEGRDPAVKTRSHIPVLSFGLPIKGPWSMTVTLPFEVSTNSLGENSKGVQDVVLGVRYRRMLAGNQSLMALGTFDLPTSSIEHRAFGFGAGLLYNNEWEHWAMNLYSLARTEHTFDAGEKRGNRILFGTGLAYAHEKVPFSPQIGFSWEHLTRGRQGGVLVPGSNTSALMVHPAINKTFRDETIQIFNVVSIPVKQWSGDEGWQRWRFATGLLWTF
jgi:hypothetical protein